LYLIFDPQQKAYAGVVLTADRGTVVTVLNESILSPPYPWSRHVTRSRRILAARLAGLSDAEARLAAGDAADVSRIGEFRMCVVGLRDRPTFVVMTCGSFPVALEASGQSQLRPRADVARALLDEVQAYERITPDTRVAFVEWKTRGTRLRVAGLPPRYNLTDDELSQLCRFMRNGSC
jgi:hypothetical protein